ncbi:MAG: potassium channel family protein [Hydrococcus sp. Prado102]|jgi:hypothetical protein|nr:potassium channel family protein [Hydrococcus sp. Prado102]
MGWLAQAIGTGLVLLAIADIYLTVLYPRGDKGIVSVPLSRGLWQLFRLAGRAGAKRNRTDAKRLLVRDRILSFMGPTLLVTTVAIWILLLLFGFALIAWPALGKEIQMEMGETPTDFMTAIYYSGFSLATLGTGDITPRTGTYRLLMVLETILGFSTLTMTLTYFESVYSQLIQRNSFALSLYNRTGRTADAAEMLARFGTSGSFDSSTKQTISNMAQSLLNILETHHSYPALGYFRLQESYYSLARIAFTIMDAVTLIKSALSEEEYRSLVGSAAVKELEESGMQFLHELSQAFLPKGERFVTTDSERDWRSRYDRAIERLEAEEIKTVSNREAGADLYVTLRHGWNPYVMALSRYMEHEWSAIAPVND